MTPKFIPKITLSVESVEGKEEIYTGAFNSLKIEESHLDTIPTTIKKIQIEGFFHLLKFR